MIDKVAEQEKRLSASSLSPKSSPKFFKRKKKEERDVNAALNERLSKLLMENETVKEKVRFLENTVRLLNVDLEKYKKKNKISQKNV
tara:strand:+ start:203 stop:463 length:261 start_codon:yes stop_codon:yes gene_type:complete